MLMETCFHYEKLWEEINEDGVRYVNIKYNNKYTVEIYKLL